MKRLQTKGDMSLSLIFEKSLVTLLSQTSGRINDEFRIGAKWNFSVGKQIVSVKRFPICRRPIGTYLQKNQIILPLEMCRPFL